MVISFIATWFKRLGAVCLVFVILWHLAPHGASRRGRAMVHLASTDRAVVWIDQRFYRVDSAADTPVICELAPGRHRVQVWRHGSLEGEARFTVEAGRDAVIGPLDRAPPEADAGRARPAAPAGGANPAGLAAHLPAVGASAVAN